MPDSAVHLDAVLGSAEISVNISSFLFGCATVQTYIYYHNFPKDPSLLKWLVASVWLLELGQHVVVSHVSYVFSVLEWGNPQVLLAEPHTASASFFIGSLISPLVESFYLYRIFVLSRRHLMVYVGLVLVWLRYAGWVVLGVQQSRLGGMSGEFLASWSWLIIVALVIGTVVNTAISLTVGYLLYRERGPSILRTTQLIDRLINWTFRTGLITSVGFLAGLVFFVSMKENMIWVNALSWLPKVFSNCMLASLNARNTMEPLNQIGVIEFASNGVMASQGEQLRRWTERSHY